MPLVRIDAKQIVDWETFHNVFAEAFGFPAFYGRNMNAWIDCMTCLDDPSSGMTTVHGTATDFAVLQIDNIGCLPTDIYADLIECASFVNWRRIEQGDGAILSLSFCKS